MNDHIWTQNRKRTICFHIFFIPLCFTRHKPLPCGSAYHGGFIDVRCVHQTKSLGCSVLWTVRPLNNYPPPPARRVPWNDASLGWLVPWTIHSRGLSSKGRIVQGTKHPRLFVMGQNGWGRNNIAPFSRRRKPPPPSPNPQNARKCYELRKYTIRK